MSAAVANYNMSFNNGSFLKNKEYEYKNDPNDSKKILITTEEHKEQDLLVTEFNMLFTILKN